MFYILGIITGLLISCFLAILYTRNKVFIDKKVKEAEKFLTPRKEATIVDMEEHFLLRK